MTTNYYFAYGSNLNAQDWRNWCRKHNQPHDRMRLVGTAYLPDHDLAFTRYSRGRQGGVLDVVQRTGQVVAGGIFEVLDGGWDVLDRKEGAGSAYERVERSVFVEGDREIRVSTYRALGENGGSFIPPHPTYVEVVRAGLQQLELNTSSLDAAARNELSPWVIDSIFTYGTLLRGESRFALLRPYGPNCILLARCFGRLVDLGAYPGMINSNDLMVAGEFIRLDEFGNAVVELDRVEGFRGFGRSGSLFRRILTHVDVGDGRIRPAWTYVYGEEGAAPAPWISENCWRTHRGICKSVLHQIATGHIRGQIQNVVEDLASRGLANVNVLWGGPEAVAEHLADQLLQGSLSERRLAQASGIWTVNVEQVNDVRC